MLKIGIQQERAGNYEYEYIHDDYDFVNYKYDTAYHRTTFDDIKPVYKD